jgi:IrrE N-terminal-like domain
MTIESGDNPYREPRAHALRAVYLAAFPGAEIPVQVESIAEDLLGLRIERSWGLDCSGMLVPAERKIVLNAVEEGRDATPLRRWRFTIAHELGHWICHAVAGARPEPVFCRSKDLAQDADRTVEREANVFAAELLMPEPAVRAAWLEAPEVATCAERFAVSADAMHWRLYSFDLVSASPG